ncbi:hypothetical protein C8R47DRAFT_1193465 [Mycena vitilis]|nr:hypothetical protein C8R47DRAFT_1193465 [Mycena vitilis]
MHHCLRIAELVDLICCQLDPFSTNPGDLAAIAMTCTTLKNPALNHLWRVTPLTRLLTSCMPSDLWKDSEEGVTENQWQIQCCCNQCPTSDITRTLTLRRPICESDWRRVHLYAPRIRELLYRSSAFPRDTLLTLGRAFPPSLLPNLRHLLWWSESLHCAHIFLRPSLTKISFDLRSTADCAVFTTLGETCPKLSNICITLDGDLSGMDFGPLSDFVAHLPRVETISVPWLAQDALEHLSALPTLKSLKMRGIPEVSPAFTAAGFLALRHLSLAAAAPAEITRLLRMSTDVPLETLHAALDVVPSAADVHTLFTTITASVSASTLTQLHLDCCRLWETGSPDPQSNLVHPSTLVLLLCFENLTELHLTFAAGFDLDDDTVSQMARAWPRLEDLYLAGVLPTASGTRPRTTLASLSAIARHCPRMRSLTIAFDGSTIPPSAAVSLGVVGQQKSLHDLNVLHSPITTVSGMEQFLLGVFPNLREVRVSGSSSEEADSRYERWQKVSTGCWRHFYGYLLQREQVELELNLNFEKNRSIGFCEDFCFGWVIQQADMGFPNMAHIFSIS